MPQRGNASIVPIRNDHTLLLRLDVTLTPLTREQADRMSIWMRDRKVREGIGLRYEPSLDSTVDWIRRKRNDPSSMAFAVLRAGEHVGNAVLDRRDLYLHTSRLSIYIGAPEARGGGVGTTAVFRAAQFAFAGWGLHKLWLITHEKNLAALRICEKVGFVREGLLCEAFILAGRRLAAVYMGLLRADFNRLQVGRAGKDNSLSPRSSRLLVPRR
jgi:RimJ/RimL family protein N-acetyltransferase